jgi:hypothetical protein
MQSLIWSFEAKMGKSTSSTTVTFTSVEKVIRQLCAEYLADDPALTPYEINNGLCEEFMHDVIERLGGYSDDLTDNASPDYMPGHCWVEFKGRCFDAECPCGVNNWQDLPIFVRYSLRQQKSGT